MATFDLTVKDAENMLAIHRERVRGPGRRTLEPSLNRGAVVLAVASWQAQFEYLALHGLSELEPPAGQPRQEYKLSRRQ